MNEDRKPRQFFEARPDGGRPRVTYEEFIEEMGRKEWLKTEKSGSLSPRTPRH